MANNLLPNAQRMNDLLALSHVPRWSVVRLARPQSVADHSFRVAIIALELATRLDITIDLNFILWALVHDGAESQSGDISGRFKREADNNSGAKTRASDIVHAEGVLAPWVRELSTGYVFGLLIKIADVVETCSFIWMNRTGPHSERVWRDIYERQLPIVVDKYIRNAGAMSDEPAAAHKIRDTVNKLYLEIANETGRFDVWPNHKQQLQQQPTP